MSNIATMLGMLGSAAGGYVKGARQRKADEDEDQERAQQRELREMQMDDLRQRRSDEQALRGATASSVVSDANAGPMPEGQEARVRGTGYATMADAQAALPKIDAPEARLARRQEVLSSINPMQAAQERLALAQTDAAEQDLADKVYARGLSRSLLTGGWEGFTKQLSDSPFGGAKFGLVKDAKGKKVRISVLGEDGKDTGDGMDFTDDEDGRMKALNVAMSVSDPQSRMAFYKWSKETNQKQANWLADFGLKEKELASTDRYRTSMADAAGVRADKAGGGKGSGTALERMPEAEKVKLQGIRSRLSDVEGVIAKSRASNEFDAASDNGKALLSERALLIDQQDALVSRYSSGEKPAAAPIPGLEVKRSGGNRAPHTGDGKVYESPAVMEERQASAGLTTLQSEYGGDIRRAQADVDELRAAVKAAPSPEAKAMLTNRLSAALYAVEAGKQMNQKPAAAAPPAQAQPRASMVQAAAPGISKSGNKELDAMLEKHMAALGQMATGVKQAEVMLAAAAKSGDPKAVSHYATALQRARDGLKAEAEKRLGNNAQAYLTSLN